MKSAPWRSLVLVGMVAVLVASGCKPTYSVKAAAETEPVTPTVSTPIPTPAPTVETAVAPEVLLPDYIANPLPLEAWTPEHIAEVKTRRGDTYAVWVTKFVEQAPNVKPGGLLFLGDSITRGFPLDEAFPTTNVINHGIGGDKIEGVQERLGLVVAAKPARIIMKIGTNDTSWMKTAETAELGARYARLLDEIHRELPDTKLTILSILPIGSAQKYDAGRERLNELNVVIKELCAERGLEFINVFPAFADANGHLRSEFTTDGVHLTPMGYWQWVKELHKAGVIDDEQLGAAEAGLGARIKRIYGIPKVADKVDPGSDGTFPGNRGTNELVIYLPSPTRPTTGTNQYGMEATVVGDTVTVVAGEGNAAIPPDGYVISGHGEGAAWITRYLKPGAKVERDGASLTPVGATGP